MVIVFKSELRAPAAGIGIGGCGSAAPGELRVGERGGFGRGFKDLEFVVIVKVCCDVGGVFC